MAHDFDAEPLLERHEVLDARDPDAWWNNVRHSKESSPEPDMSSPMLSNAAVVLATYQPLTRRNQVPIYELSVPKVSRLEDTPATQPLIPSTL